MSSVRPRSILSSQRRTSPEDASKVAQNMISTLLKGLHENSPNPFKSSVLPIRELNQVAELLEEDVGYFTCRTIPVLDQTSRPGRHSVGLLCHRCLECHRRLTS